ncbi:MAG: FtsW/RodA/SpoVE family cell cycle protein [Oscillospiraceae bacterium]|nr:FtsW/RodA/SpoVE family cell cycle protein [Oscillospiraceae bacterium]MCD8192795.1 FtsW/RodA/SpoVE family cell cycle protein [Oscillospiraceae bacterium]MCD8374891.1 FtsW/RodA/SpoVE family cell cycle protein [Oscillospiraceae bacterium]
MSLKKILPLLKDFFQRADLLLLILAVVSALYGLVAISTATASFDEGSSGYIAVQSAAIIIGIVLFVVFTVIDIDILADKWPLILAFCVVLMGLLYFFGTGDTETGNKSWLRFFGIGIQPSEVIRVAYIVLMAKHISYLRDYKRLDHVFSVFQLAVHFMIFFGMIVVISADLGSALVFAFIFVAMLFFAGLKLYWFVIGAAALAAVVPLVWTYFLADYQKERILAPYVASIDPAGEEVRWQTNQSRLALASGRLTGTGLGNGTQTQSQSIPEQNTDFIFAVIGEELGFIGCAAVLLLLLALIIRCLYVGLHCKSSTGMLACVGVAAALLFQTFENVGMCMGITPVVGLTLPLFSYGGSSVFCTFAALGIVSGVKYRPKPERFQRYQY